MGGLLAIGVLLGVAWFARVFAEQMVYVGCMSLVAREEFRAYRVLERTERCEPDRFYALGRLADGELWSRCEEVFRDVVRESGFFGLRLWMLRRLGERARAGDGVRRAQAIWTERFGREVTECRGVPAAASETVP